MSQFGYCVSNPNYDDIGQQDGGCGDNYSSLAGVDDCSMFGGMTNYQQGLLGLVPSYCNQASDYAPVRGMYAATQIPAFAGLQYYPTQVGLVDGAYYAAPKIISASGAVVPVAGQKQDPAAAAFINQVVAAADASQARNQVATQQILAKAGMQEKQIAAKAAASVPAVGVASPSIKPVAVITTPPPVAATPAQAAQAKAAGAPVVAVAKAATPAAPVKPVPATPAAAKAAAASGAKVVAVPSSTVAGKKEYFIMTFDMDFPNPFAEQFAMCPFGMC